MLERSDFPWDICIQLLLGQRLPGCPLFPPRLPHLCARAAGSGGADVVRLGKSAFCAGCLPGAHRPPCAPRNLVPSSRVRTVENQDLSEA